MSVKVENLEKNMAKMTIEVAAEEVAKALEKAYQKQKKNISVPGFRKGKVPMAMIEKMYGEGVFYEEASNILIQQEYVKAMAESELEITSQPTIDIVQIEKGKPFIFTAEVAVKPEVKLGEYKGVEVSDVDTSVVAADVNAEIDKEREANARTITVEKRGIKKGDVAIIDFEGYVDGEKFAGGTAQNHPLEIGSHSFIDTFEDQLVGKKTGAEVDVNVTFPEDYQAKELAGKPALFKVKINEIKTKELPKADDEFAQDVSEFETLKEYKADIKKKLVEAKKNAAKRAQEDEALDKVVANCEIDVPEPMINYHVDDMLQGMSQQMASQGLTMEQYMQFTGTTPQSLREQMRPEAIRRIKSSLVLEAIAKDAKVKVTDKAIEKELEKMAEMYHMEIEKIKEMVGENEKESIRKDLEIQGALDLIVKNAVVKKDEKKKTAKKTTAKKTTKKEEDAE
ncbi:MAG: trigger factor [Lachnospiraceae bacterium]|nr:trigger factor [Lachnospiraceae bacterium]